MSLDPTTFESIVPSRYITFTIPNPFSQPFPFVLDTPLIRISVIDSQIATADAIGRVAAMLVPANRESDWIFSTEAGHLQLLLTFPDLNRLILVAKNSSFCCNPRSYEPPLCTTDTNRSEIEDKLVPLMLALTPKLAFVQNSGFPEIPFLSYEDEVIRSSVLEVCVGHSVGEMIVENVELELVNGGREFRRRLRFKRMPNLVQSQARIYPPDESDKLDCVEFRVDTGVLVQPYLNPMVAGISLICSHLDGRIQEGFRPRALCLGVGGGSLVSFLTAHLGFEVVAVEEDDVVLSLAKKYFGLRDNEMVDFCIGDGIELVETNAFSGKDLSLKNSVKNFDVIMVDLDSSDARIGTGAPPLEFVRTTVLQAARQIISRNGVLITNIIPPSKSFYETVVAKFQDVFDELYEIDVGNGENMVLVASVSEIQPTRIDQENHFLQKLRATSIPQSYMDSIRKIRLNELEGLEESRVFKNQSRIACKSHFVEKID